jgi:hypothetical protein
VPTTATTTTLMKQRDAMERNLVYKRKERARGNRRLVFRHGRGKRDDGEGRNALRKVITMKDLGGVFSHQAFPFSCSLCIRRGGADPINEYSVDLPSSCT